ncbi:MAG: glycosyltransferase family 2 protein [Nocardioidaceae bacterium]
MTQSVSVTIPAYNEVETLEEVVSEALAACRRVTPEYEVLVVDDGSTDGTGPLADDLATRHPGAVRVVHHRANRGFSGAMLSCMRNAEKEWIFLGPADGQANYADLERLWEQSSDKRLVFSYRVSRGDPWSRKLSSWLWYSGLHVLFGRRVPEFSSTFLFHRATLEQVPVEVREDASNFLPVLFLQASARGIPVGLVGTEQPPRRGGVAKGADWRVILRTIAEDLRLFWHLRVRRRLQ